MAFEEWKVRLTQPSTKLELELGLSWAICLYMSKVNGQQFAMDKYPSVYPTYLLKVLGFKFAFEFKYVGGKIKGMSKCNKNKLNQIVFRLVLYEYDRILHFDLCLLN